MVQSSIAVRPWVAGLVVLLVVASFPGQLSAWQEPNPAGAAGGVPAATSGDGGPSVVAPAPAARPGMSFFELLTRGGILMWPLLGLSILAVTLTIERAIALRRERIFPAKLLREIARHSELPGGFDPRLAYRLSQQYPSSAARVLRAMLLKTGRPQGEIEHTISEAVQREASRLQGPVSWLALTAAIAPLVGLLGTVQGITQAFFEFTQIPANQNPGNALATGIYTALVTTLAGLMIAIPATIAAHFFENRITNSLNDVEEMFANLLPQLERYEGRVRFAPPADKNGNGNSPWRDTEQESSNPGSAAPR